MYHDFSSLKWKHKDHEASPGSVSNIYYTLEYYSYVPYMKDQSGFRTEKTTKQDAVQAILSFRQYNLRGLMVSEIRVIKEDAM